MGEKTNILKNEKLLEKVYDDAIHPSAKRFGKIGEALLKFVALPFTFLGLTAEQLEEKYKKFIAETLNKVPDEKRETPKSAIAGPLLDHIKYLFDDESAENLIQMFSDLLANSINSEVNKNVHVSYIHTLKQLGYIEAEILRKIYIAVDYEDLGVTFKRNCDREKGYIKVLSDEAEPLVQQDENVFFYHDLIILDDQLPVSDSVFHEALNILEHHNLIYSFRVNKYKNEDSYTLERHDKDNLNQMDPYGAINGYGLTQYGEDFMSVCLDPTTNNRSEFLCEKCNTVFRNIYENGMCPRCGSGNVKLL